MKAIIVARVSTEEQKEAGNSLPAQIRRLKNYCQRKGFEIIKQFSFDESAYKDQREEFDKILDYVIQQKEKVALCFDKVDRFSRNPFDKRVSLLFEKATKDEIELHFISDGQVINSNITAEQKFQFSMRLGLAKYFSDAISDSVKRAREGKLYRGELPGPAPFGYKNTIKEGRKWVEPDPFKAQVVKHIFEWYATGTNSMNTIRKLVQEQFHLKFSKSKVEHILKNPFYCGIIIANNKQYPHIYENIISKEIYDKVQEIRKGHHKKHFKFAGLPFLYRGMIKCSSCGCSITPERKTKPNGKKYVYYHCTQYHGKHDAEWVREKVLTQQFADILSQLQIPKPVLQQIVTVLKETNQAKSAHRKQLLTHYQTLYEQYAKRIEVMYEDRLDGRITVDAYDKKRKQYRQEQEKIERKIQQLRITDEEYYVTVEYLVKLAAKAKELFISSEEKEKRLILQLTLRNLELDGKKVRYQWQKPFDILANYASRPNWLPG